MSYCETQWGRLATCPTAAAATIQPGRLATGPTAILVVFCAAGLCAGEARRLTHDGKRKIAPVFTAGGQEVVYSVHEAPNLVAIFRLRLADGTRERIHPGLVAHQFDPAFSPDGRYHAFALSSTSPQLVLVIQDLKEKTEAVFRPRDARAVVRGPSFAPDGSRVVFSLSDHGGQQIASMDRQGKNLKKLAESTGLNAWPSFSPDGRLIAFGSTRDGDGEIYVMDSSGDSLRRLTRNPGMDLRPAWSPDGRRLAFTSFREGPARIFVMNADGTNPRRVATASERDDYAVWHPDGKQLLMVSEQAGKFDLYLAAAPE